jgi:hypothetical protein
MYARAVVLSVVLSLLGGGLPSAAVGSPTDVEVAASDDVGYYAPRGRLLFPTNRLTVRDDSQLTGRRINLPLPDCSQEPALCDEHRLLNQLDGFDLDPRLVVQLTAKPTLSKLRRHHFYVQRASGGQRIRINRMVYNPRTLRLYGQPRRQLRPGTRYRAVWNGEGPASVTTFTTLSATRGLIQMRRQLDSGKAYRDAGIKAGARGLKFNIIPGGGRAVFDAPGIVEMIRYNHRKKGEPLVEESVLDSARSGARYYAFGYYRSPQWLTQNRFIPPTSTRTGEPEARRAQKVGISLIVPAGAKPDGGWPTAIFGPGVTRSKYDLFLAADANDDRGIATIALDPVGHAWGPKSKTGVTTVAGGGEVRFPAFGRARVVNRAGVFDPVTNLGVPVQPHRLSIVALRDGLRQTALDVMALIRAIRRGVDVDKDDSIDLRRRDISLYAQSLGGIYGTMVAGVDPRVKVAALNVPGGPIVEIARQAPGFRPEVAHALGWRRPSLLNGGLDCFTESTPLWGQRPIAKPAKGAIAIQAYGARSNWISRSGSPETFAPLLRLDPLGDPKRVFYQFAYGDETVPNPTSHTIVRAGRLRSRTTYYRNDRTPTRDTDPHGFLLDPRISGRTQGQQQVLDFIASGGTGPIDPDGPGPVWETPLASYRALQRRHYDLRAQVEARDQYDGRGCPE